MSHNSASRRSCCVAQTHNPDRTRICTFVSGYDPPIRVRSRSRAIRQWPERTVGPTPLGPVSSCPLTTLTMHDAGCSATGLSSPHALTPHTTQARYTSTQTVWGSTTRERHAHTPWHSGPPRHEKNSTYLGRPTSHTNSTRIRMRRVRSPPKLPSSHRSFMIGGSSQSPHGAEPLRSQPASPKGSTPQRGVARECMLIACLISEA